MSYSLDDIENLAPPFEPVRLARARHDGWTEGRQRQFIKALCATGSVGAAARVCAMSRKSAYALRARNGAESFAEARDIAVDIGRERLFDYQLDRAFNGVTTLRLRLGGAVDISHGLDGGIVASRFKAPDPGAGFARKGDIR